MAPVANQPSHTPTNIPPSPQEAKAFESRPAKPAGRSDTAASPPTQPQRPWWMKRFSSAQWQQMERDDYVLAASIFGILTAIFAVGLILTSLAVLLS